MSNPQEIWQAIDELGGVSSAFSPMAWYNPDGDCLEFHLSNESYYARRLDGWVTVYIGEDSGEIVGGVVKGVKGSLLRRFPGIRVFLEGNEVNIHLLLQAAALESADEQKQRTYRDILSKTADQHLTTQLDEQGVH